jgi:hypothetical protein
LRRAIDMEFQTQFRGIIPDGETRTWFTFGWPSSELVLWGVLPIAAMPSARLSLDRVDIENDGATNTYFLTISNNGSGYMIFDAVYVTIPGTLD